MLSPLPPLHVCFISSVIKSWVDRVSGCFVVLLVIAVEQGAGGYNVKCMWKKPWHSFLWMKMRWRRRRLHWGDCGLRDWIIQLLMYVTAQMNTHRTQSSGCCEWGGGWALLAWYAILPFWLPFFISSSFHLFTCFFFLFIQSFTSHHFWTAATSNTPNHPQPYFPLVWTK